MKNKKILILFILGIIFAFTVGVGATTLIYSKDVTYDNTASGLSSTTVQGALDELYEKAKNAPNCDSNGTCTVTCPSGKYLLMMKTGYKCTTTKDLLLENMVTSGDGLYVDGSEDGCYYYSGANPNNDIVFNGEPYRILRIEKDGRIKIIKMISINNMNWSTYSTNSWQYGLANDYLNETWLTTQAKGQDYNSLAFNNNWYIGSVSYENAKNASESYKEEKHNEYTASIGLISVSEYLNSKIADNTYLSFSSGWWTISAYAGDTYRAWYINNENLSFDYVNNNNSSVFPVLYLKSDITLTGSGTSTDPYCIAGSNCSKNLDFTQRAS